MYSNTSQTDLPEYSSDSNPTKSNERQAELSATPGERKEEVVEGDDDLSPLNYRDGREANRSNDSLGFQAFTSWSSSSLLLDSQPSQSAELGINMMDNDAVMCGANPAPAADFRQLHEPQYSHVWNSDEAQSNQLWNASMSNLPWNPQQFAANQQVQQQQHPTTPHSGSRHQQYQQQRTGDPLQQNDMRMEPLPAFVYDASGKRNDFYPSSNASGPFPPPPAQEQQPVHEAPITARSSPLARPAARSSESVTTKAYDTDITNTDSFPNTTEYNGVKYPPLRPLTPYNFFFRDERERILQEQEGGGNSADVAVNLDTESRRRRLLQEHWGRDRSRKRMHRKSHGKISFIELSKRISSRWKKLELSEKEFYRDISALDYQRFQHEVDREKLETAMVSGSNSESHEHEESGDQPGRSGSFVG